jgi:hypothetical protein
MQNYKEQFLGGGKYYTHQNGVQLSIHDLCIHFWSQAGHSSLQVLAFYAEDSRFKTK